MLSLWLIQSQSDEMQIQRRYLSQMRENRPHRPCLPLLQVPSEKATPCNSTQRSKTLHVEADEQSPDDANSSDGDFKLLKLSKNSSDPIMVSVKLNGQSLEMEADTGAAFSIISEVTR